MARFKFKLATVLKHRLMLEQECQRDLATVVGEREKYLNQLRAMQQTISQSKRQLGENLVGKVNLDSISHFARYSGQTTARAHEIVLAIAALEKKIDTARAKLVEATKQRKAIELLRDRQLAEFNREQNRLEANQLDELGTQAHQRRMSQEVVA